MAAILVASDTACEEHGWEPMARIVDTQVVGVDPETVRRGPIPATDELLEANDTTVDAVDRFEVNEAFVSVVGVWLAEIGAAWDRTNVWGGAIAHGHPLGATGAALLGELLPVSRVWWALWLLCDVYRLRAGYRYPRRARPSDADGRSLRGDALRG